ncbi:hypothetical protein F2Q69_00030523 [Brassica cretica]|uniref:Uncharacterized protein n=1 Tax=Brassica cretica TaxID=69181 RepID=A0A8S9S3L9_BRACR|nr:hypothetical protein F2Q69_00030523 [Brassica cretica]
MAFGAIARILTTWDPIAKRVASPFQDFKLARIFFSFLVFCIVFVIMSEAGAGSSRKGSPLTTGKHANNDCTLRALGSHGPTPLFLPRSLDSKCLGTKSKGRRAGGPPLAATAEKLQSFSYSIDKVYPQNLSSPSVGPLATSARVFKQPLLSVEFFYLTKPRARPRRCIGKSNEFLLVEFFRAKSFSNLLNLQESKPMPFSVWLGFPVL